MVEAVTVGAISGMSSHRRPRVIPGLGWLALVAIFSAILWLAARHWKIAEGNGGRYGVVAFIATNIVVVVIMIPAGVVPWERFAQGLGHWSSMVRVGMVFRYLAATIAAAGLRGHRGVLRLFGGGDPQTLPAAPGVALRAQRGGLIASRNYRFFRFERLCRITHTSSQSRSS